MITSKRMDDKTEILGLDYVTTSAAGKPPGKNFYIHVGDSVRDRIPPQLRGINREEVWSHNLSDTELVEFLKKGFYWDGIPVHKDSLK